MDVEEALRLADQYSKHDKDVPSVSRTLAAEVRRLREEVRDAWSDGYSEGYEAGYGDAEDRNS